VAASAKQNDRPGINPDSHCRAASRLSARLSLDKLIDHLKSQKAGGASARS